MMMSAFPMIEAVCDKARAERGIRGLEEYHDHPVARLHRGTPRRDAGQARVQGNPAHCRARPPLAGDSAYVDTAFYDSVVKLPRPKRKTAGSRSSTSSVPLRSFRTPTG